MSCVCRNHKINTFVFTYFLPITCNTITLNLKIIILFSILTLFCFVHTPVDIKCINNIKYE